MPNIATVLIYCSVFAIVILTITGFLLLESIIPQNLPKSVNFEIINYSDYLTYTKYCKNRRYCVVEKKQINIIPDEYINIIRYVHYKTTSFLFFCLFSFTIYFFSYKEYLSFKKT